MSYAVAVDALKHNKQLLFVVYCSLCTPTLFLVCKAVGGVLLFEPLRKLESTSKGTLYSHRWT